MDNRAFSRAAKTLPTPSESRPHLFKNLILYRIGADWVPDFASLEAGLQKTPFIACAATQPVASGWTPPRGIAHAPLLESVAGQWLLRLQTEQKVLPSSVVKRRSDEIAAHTEKATGRKPGKKETKEIREQAVQELLPMAFTKQSGVSLWIDPEARLLMVDAASAGRADEALTLLVKAAEGLAIAPLHTAESPAAVMSDWLLNGEPPAAFSVDRECELKSSDEARSVVRYARHPLDIDEIRQHIGAGKLPTRLAITWQGRLSLLLTDSMQLRKISFLDVVFEGSAKAGKEEAFDADAAIGTGELRKLIPDLLDALGGEALAGPAAGSQAVRASEPAAAPQEAQDLQVAVPAPW